MEELRTIVRNLLERSQVIQNELRFSQNHAFSSTSDDGDLSLTSETILYTASDCEQQKLDAQFDLTKREREVLEQLVEGHSNIEIAQILHLSHRTIEKYVSSLLGKLKLNNRIELVRYAMRHHLV